jgi:uncharacterized membrane protein YbjE (DUF340 family)
MPLDLYGSMVLLHSVLLSTTDSRSMQDYLNLLTMTAIIKSTNTVIIAIVTILFVAILVIRQHNSSPTSPDVRHIPSRHASQRFVTPVCVALTLKKSTSRVLDGFPLSCEV